jgi:hypothetical protein
MKINQYPLQETTVNEQSFFDMDHWDGLAFESAKITGADLRKALLGGLFTQTANGAQLTGTGEQSLLGTGLGSLTVPANGFTVGDTFHANVSGVISAANNETIRVKVKSGSVILADSGVITLPTITTKIFEIEMDFCVRALGAAGVAVLATHGEFTYNKDSNDRFEGKNFFLGNTSTFDTTISNTLSFTIEWGSANATNQIASLISYLKQVF